ncbi:MAG TPA: hypothetical protein VHW64_05355 [Nocardioides sp.]|uniref:DUF6928 family protein n=1 Tax=Nocardioides sp. TaxID=35761 RepID=UPI002E367FA9|nr:hypothetical protein [Nocardioides sp.]HEX3930107.1 hypothetical protein [Nocardioides sp.]
MKPEVEYEAATRDAHLYNPTILHPRYVKAAKGRALVLLTQRSFNDMFAHARWEDGGHVRSISVNPVGGIVEDIGAHPGPSRPRSGALHTPWMVTIHRLFTHWTLAMWHSASS